MFISDPGLNRLLDRLGKKLSKDNLVQNLTNNIRQQIDIDRVVLYYFYSQWEGRVTFESLSSIEYSIFGTTGPDECFNQEYADLYLNGRVTAISDISTAPIAQCHRHFLANMQVRANLVVPIVTSQGLWGLLVAHHCQSSFNWSEEHIKIMKSGAKELAESETIHDK